jgi:dTDP-4-amino-4,6-dideoxygalactose transaminase/predicted dehydrogenase
VSAYQRAGAQVVAVSDVRVSALKDALDRWPGVRAYRDYGRMLDEEQPDLVSVCTWPETHAAVVTRAAHGIVRGILCEKPLALSMAEVDEMRAVCRERGVRLAGGHQYRFHPYFVRAAHMIATGRLGRVERVAGHVVGTLADNGPHLLDAAMYLLGDPAVQRVQCLCERAEGSFYQNVPAEVAASGVVTLADGTRLHFETGHRAPMFFQLTVHGSEGTLEVTPTTLLLDGRTAIGEEPPDEATYRSEQFSRFMAWVRGSDAEYAADETKAALAAELVLAAYESARRRGSVELPLANRGAVIHELWPQANPATANTSSGPKRRPVRTSGGRLAVDGGQRTVKEWFSHDPVVGWPELARLTRTIQSRQLNRTYGYQVTALEREFAALYGSPRAVASTSGTASIHVALGAIDPEPCDEVITTPLTDMGSIIPILACNCIPVFADVDPMTGNMTAESIAARITSRTRAVILVHLFGRPADLEPIVSLLSARGIPLIEDCSQAHGAEYRGRKVGTFGDFGCFSLQQSKQITCGDGGLTLVNREALAARAALYADKGWSREVGREHLFLGMNYRMTELQAAVARAQLRRLPRLLAGRRAAADALTRRLDEIEGIIPPAGTQDAVSSWWVYEFGLDIRSVGMGLDELYHLLGAEGMQLMRRYLPCAAFEYQAMLHQHTYGKSRYPFSATDYVPPDIADYTGFTAFQEEHLFIPWGNRVLPRHTAAMAAAIQKVVPQPGRSMVAKPALHGADAPGSR